MRRMDLRRKRSNQGDRLTNLPDEILTRILGMLPIKNVVAITLMFNKFMRAFSALRNLDLDISHVSGGNPRERSLNFWKFMDYVFENCKSKQLGRFRLSYCYPKERKVVGPRQRPRPGHGNPALETVRLNAWISFPLARRVRELDICIHVGEPLPKLPMSSIIKCPTLEVLKIDANLELDVDYVLVSPVVNLPRLKLLHLRSLLINEDSFVTTLVQLCPKLEDLLVDCWWERCFVVDIGSTSLRSLVLSVNKCYGRISSYSVVINTPNLECLKYEDNIALHYSVSDMTALVQAEFTIRSEFKSPSEKEAFEHLCTVLSSTSHVSQLSLLYCSAVCLDHAMLENKLPVFQNLNHLELGYYRRTSWHNVLMVLLNHSPLLETLIFAEGIVSGDDNDIDESDLWRRTQEIPFCCKSHLKHIAIKQYFGIQRELDLVQFLLGKTLYLETLVVWRSELANSDQDEVSMKNTLEQLPKASTFCSIIVHPSVIA